MQVKVKRVDPRAVIPTRGSEQAAGWDLTAISREGPVYRTGLAFDIPDGYVMLVFSRSGHGFRENTRLANCVGVVDSDYTGEVFVKLTRDDGGHIDVLPGDRVAQAVFLRLPKVEMIETENLKETKRGINGLGSTGK